MFKGKLSNTSIYSESFLHITLKNILPEVISFEAFLVTKTSLMFLLGDTISCPLITNIFKTKKNIIVRKSFKAQSLILYKNNIDGNMCTIHAIPHVEYYNRVQSE
jgi:hypothetical protein